jgi:hypothetical protein
MEIKLTSSEKAKYDEVYEKITSQYSKKDMIILEEDDVAKFFLKNMIIRYIFTCEFPKHLGIEKTEFKGRNKDIIEVHYDAKIPLQEKPETQVEDIEVITENQPEASVNTVNLDYDNILSSLMLERTESDEFDKSIQDK